MSDDVLFQPDTSLFVPQEDDYSCGPASVTTVSNIYNGPGDYHFFRDLLAPCPETGVCNHAMTRQIADYLPIESAGEATYHGGIAIANIIRAAKPGEKEPEEGHYVVFLSQLNQDIIYYDPYDDEIIHTPRQAIEWVSGCGDFQRWSINFEPLPGSEFEVWQKLLHEEN